MNEWERIEALLDVIRVAYDGLETYGGHIGGCPGADGPCHCGWREEYLHALRKREKARALLAEPSAPAQPAPLDVEEPDAERWLHALILHVEAVHACDHTAQARQAVPILAALAEPDR